VIVTYRRAVAAMNLDRRSVAMPAFSCVNVDTR
jgi:hypothetical protein